MAETKVVIYQQQFWNMSLYSHTCKDLLHKPPPTL